MGIKVEFNSDLALRNYKEFEAGRRKLEECIPKNLKVGEIYKFLKNGQRNYWLKGEVPLLETQGNQVLSKPKASVMILEAVHFAVDREVWTKGKYKVLEVSRDGKVMFESYARAGERYA